MRRYEEFVRLHIEPSLGRIQLANLNAQHLEALYAQKRKSLSVASVHQLHVVIHEAPKKAVRLKRVGLPRGRFHDLRHTAATLMLSSGIHPKIVSEQLGHSSSVITLDLYSHVTPTMQAEAARARDAL